MQISIASSLKERSRLAEKINEIYPAMEEENSMIEGAFRSVDVKAKFQKYKLLCFSCWLAGMIEPDRSLCYGKTNRRDSFDVQESALFHCLRHGGLHVFCTENFHPVRKKEYENHRIRQDGPIRYSFARKLITSESHSRQ